MDGITITVTADAGVLPADAVLQASRITDETALAGYTQAVDAADSGANAAAANLYAFDITILNAAGEAVEPDKTKGEVKVAFSNPDPEKWDVSELSLYHVDEAAGTAQALDTLGDETAQTVAAEAPGFSPYLLLGAAAGAILHLPCGSINDPNWTEIAPFTYQAVGNPSSFPVPVLDAAVAIEGWYPSYYTMHPIDKVSVPEAGKDYYPKLCQPLRASASSDYMKYMGSGSAYWISGLDGSREIRTTSDIYSFSDYYRVGASKTPKGTGAIPFTRWTKAGSGIYFSRLVTFEGRYERVSYYFWNQNSKDAKQISFGTEVVELGVDAGFDENPGKTSLTLGSDDGGKYAGPSRSRV